VIKNQRKFWQQPQYVSHLKFYYRVPTPYAESMVPFYPATFAHGYNDEGGWEIPRVYTDTYMKSNWSETEICKINEWWFLYDMTDISDKQLKIKVYWYVMLCPGQVLPLVGKGHSALEMWETTYPTILPNILKDLICNNCTIRTSNLAHTHTHIVAMCQCRTEV
jgi:hypothetical protein